VRLCKAVRFLINSVLRECARVRVRSGGLLRYTITILVDDSLGVKGENEEPALNRIYVCVCVY
jgi:hypothetical protein